MGINWITNYRKSGEDRTSHIRLLGIWFNTHVGSNNLERFVDRFYIKVIKYIHVVEIKSRFICIRNNLRSPGNHELNISVSNHFSQKQK